MERNEECEKDFEETGNKEEEISDLEMIEEFKRDFNNRRSS